jgi:hypothetical protein
MRDVLSIMSNPRTRQQARKQLYLVGDATSGPASWSSTTIGQSGITSDTVFSAVQAQPVPADIADPVNASATQAALNNWAVQVGSPDPVFPLSSGQYDTATQEACALYQLWLNDPTGGGAASPNITVDGLAGPETWAWLATFGSPPAAVTPATPPAPAPAPTPPAPSSMTGGLTSSQKMAIGVAAGAVGLGALWWIANAMKGGGKRRRK